MSRFAATLRKGGALYGVGIGCDEWRVEPSGAIRRGVAASGDLAARRARGGRMYSFSYDLMEQQGGLRLSMAGRGGWTPARGVTFSGSTDGYAVIGVGAYCVEVVDVRTSPVSSDAVSVGDETWFITQEACSQHRPTTNFWRCSEKESRRAPSE